MLGVTADNASNNDMMIEHLATLIDTFPSAMNQTQCFTHILNLIAKSVLHQFEALKVKGGKVLDNAVWELAVVFDDLEDDDVADDDVALDGEGNKDGDEENDVDDDVVDDDEDRLPDEWSGMLEEELVSLEKSVKPVQLVLTKVSEFKLLLNVIKNTFPTALRHFLGLQKFLHHYPPSMVQCSWIPCPWAMHDATWCAHSLEFNLRYAQVCH